MVWLQNSRMRCSCSTQKIKRSPFLDSMLPSNTNNKQHCDGDGQLRDDTLAIRLSALYLIKFCFCIFLWDSLEIFYSSSAVHTSCRNNNGGCSHLCLLEPKSYKCACPNGVALQKDGMTCNEGEHFKKIVRHQWTTTQ